MAFDVESVSVPSGGSAAVKEAIASCATAGVVRAIVYYDYLVAMADAA